MNDEEPERLRQMDDETLSDIERKARRRLWASRRKSNAMWYGLGTMGVVGWSVAVPVVLGVLAGVWLDEHVPVPFSWVLTGLTVGVVVGCANAWMWISSEREKIQARREIEEDE